MIVTLKLTEEETDYILNLIAEQPIKDAKSIFDKVMSQGIEQYAKTQEEITEHKPLNTERTATKKDLNK
jgi:hypothetical protein